MSIFKLNTHTYNLFYLFVCIIWVPIQLYYIHVDAAGRTMMLLSIIAVILNYPTFFKQKKLFRSAPFICWTILVVFSFINSMVKGFVSDKGFLNFIWVNFLSPYVFLLISIIELDKDQNRCLKTLLLAQLFYLLIGAMHISAEAFSRASAEGLGNLLPLTASVCVFIAGLLLCKGQLKGKWITFGAIVVFVIIIILLAATRKAFGAMILAIAGVVLGYSKRFSFKMLILFTIFALVIYFGIDYVLNNTLMGERLASSAEQYDVPLSSNPRVNKFLMSLLGDRSIMYYITFQMFPQHPLTGIGLENFSPLTQLGVRLHTEYMVQLCENGLIGFSLLIIFYVTFFRGLNKKRKQGNNTMMYLFGLLMILFLNLTVWTYNMQFVMIVYAVLISFIYSTPTPHTTSSQEILQ